MSWTKQHQLKLRQRAAQVLQEVQEDQVLLQQIQQTPALGEQPPFATDDTTQVLAQIVTFKCISIMLLAV